MYGPSAIIYERRMCSCIIWVVWLYSVDSSMTRRFSSVMIDSGRQNEDFLVPTQNFHKKAKQNLDNESKIIQRSISTTNYFRLEEDPTYIGERISSFDPCCRCELVRKEVSCLFCLFLLCFNFSLFCLRSCDNPDTCLLITSLHLLVK